MKILEVIDKHLKKEFLEIDKLLDQKEIFSSERLFKCILGLNKTESKILAILLKNKDVGTSELTDLLKMDRSSIQKSIQDLLELKLIERKSISMKDYNDIKKIEDGKTQGYLYVYNAKSMNLIKKELKSLLDKWYGSMVKYIENLDNLCECCGFKIC